MGSPAVDAIDYARNLVNLKRLGSLFDRVDALEKQSGTKN